MALTLGLLAFAAAVEGYLFTWVSLWMRVIFTLATIAVFYPVLLLEVVGCGVILLLAGINLLQQRRVAAAA